MNRLLKTAVSVFLGAALVTAHIGTASFSVTAAVQSSDTESSDKTGDPKMVGYSVTDTDGKTLKSIDKTTEFTLYIDVKDEQTKSSDVNQSDITFTGSTDNFSCGSAAVTKTSANDDALAATITVKNCKWVGDKQNFDFTLGYGSKPYPLSVTVSECSEKTIVPTPTPSPSYAEPIIKITAENVREIQADREGSFSLEIRNLGSTAVWGMLVEISSSDEIIIIDGTDSQSIGSLWTSSSESIRVKYKALSNISSSKQTFNVTLRYYYDSGSGETVGNTSASVNIPAKLSSEASGSAEPIFKITPSNTSDIKGGESGYFTLSLKNLGSVKADRILVETSASEDVVLTDGSGSRDIASVSPDSEASVRINYKALARINSPKQTFNISMKYYYDVGNGETIGNASYTVNIPSAVSASGIPAPLLKLTGQTLNTPIKGGGEYGYRLTLKNFSDIPAENITMFFDASDALYFVNGTETATVGHIDAKGSAEITVKLRTVEQISAVKQGITAHINFTYNDGESNKAAETDCSVTIIASESDESGGSSSAAAPNIIIKSYDIGTEQVAAGEAFDLKLDMFNTSAVLGVENVVMTVNAGNGINIYGGGNTFYYSDIGAGSEVSETVPLKAPATAETGTSSVSISLKYDYINNGTRETAAFEQTIFIPVYQPDKMTFDVSVPTYSIMAGEEVYITTTYLNKGRSEISNVRAEIVGDVDALSTSKVIGTVQPGGNGSFDFIVAPYMAGPCEFVIKMTYEDATLTEVTKELPVSFEVEEMYIPDDPWGDEPWTDEPVDEDGGGFPWLILWIGVGVVAAGGVAAIIIVVNVRKKKKSAVSASDFNWDDEFDDPKPAQNNDNNNNSSDNNATTV
ncbi:MAG: hypothetical protein NC299_08510 [Lachnospiraceae bacterium]|nr:hypothetical protein [Ruminococcus sp.]MCM1275394.1 hypothetical protein [Lachnospiraceae bacterium]